MHISIPVLQLVNWFSLLTTMTHRKENRRLCLSDEIKMWMWLSRATSRKPHIFIWSYLLRGNCYGLSFAYLSIQLEQKQWTNHMRRLYDLQIITVYDDSRSEGQIIAGDWKRSQSKQTERNLLRQMMRFCYHRVSAREYEVRSRPLCWYDSYLWWWTVKSPDSITQQ